MLNILSSKNPVTKITINVMPPSFIDFHSYSSSSFVLFDFLCLLLHLSGEFHQIKNAVP